MRKFCAAAAMLLSLCSLAAAQSTTETKPAADPTEQALSEFRKAWGEARTVPAKADAIRALAAGESKDPRIVRAVAKYLAPTAEDPESLLAMAAADGLGGFRGDPTASGFLVGAMGMYKKVPKMAMVILSAMGRNGHESLVPVLLERVRDLSANPGLAQTAASAFASMPIEAAMGPLLKEWGELNRKRFKEAAFGAVTQAILASVQKLSGQEYRTVAEFEIWWARHAQQFAKSGGGGK